MSVKNEAFEEIIVKLSDFKLSYSDFETEKVNEMPGGATVKLPEFWAKEPALWFVTAEGQFESKGITAESMKHAHVTTVLPVEVAT